MEIESVTEFDFKWCGGCIYVIALYFFVCLKCCMIILKILKIFLRVYVESFTKGEYGRS